VYSVNYAFTPARFPSVSQNLLFEFIMSNITLKFLNSERLKILLAVHSSTISFCMFYLDDKNNLYIGDSESELSKLYFMDTNSLRRTGMIMNKKYTYTLL
jgi:hypothetical protein